MRPALICLLLVSLQIFSNAQGVETALSKGNAYYRQRQFALAEEQYKTVLNKTPENITAQYNLAAALHEQKKWGEAHGILKKLNANTTDRTLKAGTYYNNGVVYTREKNLEASIEAYKAALRLEPYDKEARENLQKVLTEQKKQQQQQKEQEKKQQKNSNMSQREAEQKLKLLQEKEKRLQERMQQGGQKGNSMPKDW